MSFLFGGSSGGGSTNIINEGATVPAPPPQQNSPIGAPPVRKPMTPSFLGAATVPQFQSNAGGKTLLGQ